MIDKQYNQYVKRWKGITVGYDSVLEQEGYQCRFYRLSATTRQILLSVLRMAEWATRYDGTGIEQDKIDSWVALAARELTMGQVFRQNPANDCQLQASCDDVTWQTIFDYALCYPDAEPDSAAAYNSELETNAATYAGDISNLTSYWDYDGTYSDADTNNSLCWAIARYVEMVCEAQISEIEKKNEEANFFQDLAAIFGLSAGVAGVLAAVGVFASTAATGGAALALLACILAMAGEYDDEDASLFADDQTREDIVCDIYAVMDGHKPTFASWQGALSTVPGEIVNNYVHDTMQSEDLFMQFLLLTGSMVGVIGDAGIDNDCLDCPAPPWIATAQLEVAALPALLSVETGQGTFTAGQGVVGQCYTDGSDRTQAGVRVNATFHMGRIDFFYVLTNCANPPGAATQAVIDGKFGPGSTYEVLLSKLFGQVLEGSGAISVTIEKDVNNLVQAAIRSCYFNCGGSIRIRKVVIHGSGANPFDGQAGWVIT